MRAAAIGLGSNLGNRLLNLKTALRFFKESILYHDKENCIQTSDVFETEPWGVTDQPHFLNACLIIKNVLPPEELLAKVKNIEETMGRVSARRWGERKIDIDILFIDSIVYESPVLRVPHVDMPRRDFVLVPLAQIAPRWVHPVTRRSVSDMALDFRDSNLTRVCEL